MHSHYTDVEKLLLQRWPDVRALLTAYDELQDTIEEKLLEVGEELKKWAEDRGYSFEADARSAHYYFWKEQWANRRNEAGVYFVIGGFVPEGYRKVKEDHPFIWIYTELDNLKIRASQQEQFVRDLRSGLGEDLKNWQHPDVEETSPLGRYLTDHEDGERIGWMSSPAGLIEFVKAAFEQLLPLAEPIDKVLKTYR